MKKQVKYFLIWVFLVLVIISCGEDVDTFLEPDQALLVNEIELQAVEADASGSFTIPEMSAMGLSIIKIYSDGSEKIMTSEEMEKWISWQVVSNQTMSASQDQGAGAVRLQGIGTGQLTAKYLPSSDNGNRQLSSNSLTITTTVPTLDGVEVVPAENYSVDCNNSNKPNSELVVGCLMQFQALAHYNNGLTFDISDSVDWEIIFDGDDDAPACLLADNDFTSFNEENWYSARSSYLKTPDNSEKKGLVLGTALGFFDIKITYNTENGSVDDISDTVTVGSPELYTMTAEIMIPGGSTCSNNCSLYENISFEIDVKGMYDNDATAEDIISTSSITSTAENDSTIEIEKIAGGHYTGTVNIDYEAPETIKFTISEEGGLTRYIKATIYRETIKAVKKDFPVGDPLLRLSNTDIYFLLDADYNNDIFKIKDGGDYRKQQLNTSIFSNWTIQNDNYLSWQNDASWDVSVGWHAKTSNDETGDAMVTAYSEDYGSIYWNVIINNNDANPISLTINPSDNDAGTDYNIEGGVDTKFSVMALLNNGTSEVLDDGQVEWATIPPICTLDLVNALEVPCIDSLGNLLTYVPLEIIATSKKFDNDISTSMNLTITKSNLEKLEILPSRPKIHGKESVQLFVKGVFENGKSHVLPKDCLSWNDPAYAIINSDGILITDDVSEDVEISIIANTTDFGCSTSQTPGRNINAQGKSINLTIHALPAISVSSDKTNLNEDDPFNLTFTSDATFDADIIVPYNITGTSTSGIDHELVDGYVAIPAGSFSTTLSDIKVFSDELDEYNETIIITLLTDGLINARLSDSFTETVTINDLNDSPELDISFDPPGDVSEDVGTITAKFELNNGAVSGRDIPVAFTISGVDLDDYNVLDGSGDSITLPAGQNSITLDIEVLYKSSKENSETMTVNFDVSSDLATVTSNTVFNVRIDDIDDLEFLTDQINDTTCQVGDPCTIELPGLNNEGPIVNVTLTGPDWASLSPDQTEIEVDTSSANSALFLVCASDGVDEDCLFPFNITVEP